MGIDGRSEISYWLGSTRARVHDGCRAGHGTTATTRFRLEAASTRPRPWRLVTSGIVEAEDCIISGLFEGRFALSGLPTSPRP